MVRYWNLTLVDQGGFKDESGKEVDVSYRKPVHFDKPLRIGRARDNDIVVVLSPYDLTNGVSRYHCVVQADEKEVKVFDTESSNGTFVNGNQVNGEGCVLNDNDELGLGIGEGTYYPYKVSLVQVDVQDRGLVEKLLGAFRRRK